MKRKIIRELKWWGVISLALMIFATAFDALLWAIEDMTGRTELFTTFWPGQVVQGALFAVLFAPCYHYLRRAADRWFPKDAQ